MKVKRLVLKLFLCFILLNSLSSYSACRAALKKIKDLPAKCLDCPLMNRILVPDKTLLAPGSRRVVFEYPLAIVPGTVNKTIRREADVSKADEDFIEAAREGSPELVAKTFKKRDVNLNDLTIEFAALAFAAQRTDPEAQAVLYSLWGLGCGFDPCFNFF